MKSLHQVGLDALTQNRPRSFKRIGGVSVSGTRTSGAETMWPSVRENFVAFTAPLEGVLNRMYLDTKGLVTTGIGNLIDPIGAALALPWLRADNTRASQDEIIAEWQNFKSHQELAPLGGGNQAFADLATLHLSEDAIRNLVESKMLSDWSVFESRYPNIAEWPADAQLARLGHGWAMGPHAKTPKLDAALANLDFETAAQEILIPGSYAKRNAAIQQMMLNAASALQSGLDRAILQYVPGTFNFPAFKQTVVKAAEFTLLGPALVGLVGGVGYLAWKRGRK